LAAVNVNLGLKTDQLPDISLDNIEAHAGWIEDIGDWWDSKVYTCEVQPCSWTYTLPFYSVTYYGQYSNCLSGDAYAHCHECDSGCNAY
jgi:hypothetical protein